MATNLAVITAAYRIANIINAIEAASSEQGVQGLDKMNDMLSDWEEDGIELNYYPQTSLTATIPVADGFLRGIKYNLAKELHGGMLHDKDFLIAEESYERLEKGTLEVFENSFDHLPGAGRGYNINIE